MKIIKSVSVALMLLCAAAGAHAQTLAFTFDDGPQLNATPRLSPQQRNAALLGALTRHQVPAALFVTCGNGADKPDGLLLARAWGKAGHALGNHTMTHPDLNSEKITLAQYQQEVLDCDRIVAPLPGYQKWFRFTFLREGKTPEKRDGMRSFLQQQDYRNAHVTIDTSDWRFDQRLVQVLKARPDADVEPIRRAYLAHLRQRANAYRALALQLEGREIPHMLLLHHNLVNALWLDDVIAQFKADGWTFAAPATALDDPLYKAAPTSTVAGQSLLLSRAREKGLGKFPGWERLVDDGDYEMDQLKAQGL
ncbi:MAG TPA: polysaccharide deacetylase family protein [Burkholderiaceae bacterium]